jgi:hypothetical protein
MRLINKLADKVGDKLHIKKDDEKPESKPQHPPPKKNPNAANCYVAGQGVRKKNDKKDDAGEEKKTHAKPHAKPVKKPAKKSEGMFSHKSTKYEDVFWDDLPNDARDAAGKLGFDKESWDNYGWPHTEDKWFEVSDGLF